MVITTNKEKEQSFYAFHNQWCYGTLPLRHLERLINYQENACEYTRIGDYQTDAVMLAALLGTDAKEGTYTRYSETTEEHLDENKERHPDWGDNNDGITIIVADPDSKRISYCFMNIGDASREATLEGMEPKAPLSARDYVSCYYGNTDKEWKNFDIEELINFIDEKADLLTVKELREYFPAFYKGEELEREKIENAKKEDLPLLIHTEYESNKAFLERRLKENKDIPVVKKITW